MIDFRIKSFLAVVDQGSLLKASETLGITQPAVSQHLKALEEYYRMPLFEHVGRRLVLNDAGRLLYEAASRSGMLYDRFRREAGSMISGRREYRLGATLTIGEFILPSYLGRFRVSNPNLELSILIENTVSILDLLKRGEIDLALIEGPFDREQYRSRLFLTDEMIFIGNRDYIPDPSKPIGEGELISSRLILREQGSGTRYYWEEYCRTHGLHIPKSSVIMEVGSLSAIKSLVEAGIGTSVMSKRAVEKELLLGSLVSRPLSAGPLLRELCFVYTDDSPLEFIDTFIDFTHGFPEG